MDRVIVSRHPAAVEFVRRHLSSDTVEYTLSSDGSRLFAQPISGVVLHSDDVAAIGRMPDVPVLASATAEAVRGKEVFGNLPLHLAAEAELVHAIEFPAAPPRGAEYTVDDMLKAGAVLRPYYVLSAEYGVPLGRSAYLNSGGFAV
jgi:hypothetical protein